MPEPLITYELDGDVALLGLNRDDVRNAINGALLDSLKEGVLRATEEARAAVIFSHGEKHFSAGLAIESLIGASVLARKEAPGLARSSKDARHRSSRQVPRAPDRLRHSRAYSALTDTSRRFGLTSSGAPVREAISAAV